MYLSAAHTGRWLSTFLLSLYLCALATGLQLPGSNNHEPPIRSPYSPDIHSLTFQHKQFFNYDLDKAYAGSRRFQVKNTKDVLTANEYQLQPMKLTLRSHTRPTLHNPEHRLSDQHVIGRAQSTRIEPNVTDKETVVNLAKMTSDAYIYDPREPSWLNTSLGFNFTARFGWLGDGLRGHIFTTEDNMTVVISFKGTTIDPRDKLSGRDRINDNTLFGCCCGAQNPWRYAPVCDCATGYNQCSSDCLTKALLSNDSYYDTALFVAHYFRSEYPGATFWTAGHSLGGTLASLVGLTLDIPAVTYESPPQRLPAERMGLLPTPAKDRASAHHFGNTADPIHMGQCNGFISSCAIWGFTFDTKCFSGRRCLYDTVKDKGWRSNVLHHRITNVIENVLETYDTVPQCVADEECVDCAGWQFS